MCDKVLIRRYANLIDVSPDGKSTLPVSIRRLLEPELTYTYQQRLFGVDRYDPITGLNRPVRFEDRRLYKYDLSGRLCCGFGFANRITRVLNSQGITAVYIDRNYGRTKVDRYEVNWDGVLECFSLRAKQDECLLSVASSECGVIDAPTGFGKGSIIAMICLLYPKAKIHIVIRRKDVVAKTVSYLSRFLPSIGQIGGGKKKEGRRITVITADSLHHSNGDADIVLADECHELMTPSHSVELAKYKISRNFAFTATPEGRGDKADAKMESLFGPVIFKMTYQEAERLKLIAPIVVEWLKISSPYNPVADKEDIQKKRWGLWRNDFRNEIIANKARQYKDEQVLIMVDKVEHAVHLHKYLPDFELCYGNMKMSDLVTYKKQKILPANAEIVSPKKREEIRRRFESGELKKVIATDIWSTGVDFTSLQVLIRADARASTIMDTQIPGRVARTGADKEYGILVDCLDTFDPTFKAKSLARARNYRSKGWRQLGLSRR